MELVLGAENSEFSSLIYQSLLENQILFKESFDSIIPKINEFFNVESTREKGAKLLKFSIRKIPIEIIEKNINFWLQTIIKHCDLYGNDISFETLTEIIKISNGSNDLKLIIRGYLSKIIEVIIKSKDTVKNLDCLAVVLKFHGSSCGSFKNNLEKYLYKLIDITEKNQIKKIGDNLNLLQQVGASGVNSIVYKTQWKDQHEMLCKCLHNILDQIYENIDELYEKSDEKIDIFEDISKTKSNYIIYTQRLNLRFKNVAILLNQMLLNEFSAIKQINVSKILNVVERGLNVNCIKLSSKTRTLDMKAVCLIIPSVHMTLFQILQSLILCLGVNLIPFSKNICDLILRSLQWTNKQNDDQFLSYSLLRCETYKTLIIWLDKTKSSSQLDTNLNEFLKLIMTDCKTKKEIVKLKPNVEKLNKKARRQFQQAQIINFYKQKIQNESKVFDENLIKRCVCSLQALQKLIKTNCSQFHPNSTQDLNYFIIGELLEVTSGCNTSIYTIPKCRLELHKTLLCLILNPYPFSPPPTQYALDIFAIGANDSNTKLSNFCSDALLMIEKIIHPTSACLKMYNYLKDRNYNQDDDVDDEEQNSRCDLNVEMINNLLDNEKSIQINGVRENESNSPIDLSSDRSNDLKDKIVNNCLKNVSNENIDTIDISMEKDDEKIESNDGKNNIEIIVIDDHQFVDVLKINDVGKNTSIDDQNLDEDFKMIDEDFKVIDEDKSNNDIVTSDEDEVIDVELVNDFVDVLKQD